MELRAHVIRENEVDRNGRRHKRPQEIDQLGCCAAGAKANAEEM